MASKNNRVDIEVAVATTGDKELDRLLQTMREAGQDVAPFEKAAQALGAELAKLRQQQGLIDDFVRLKNASGQAATKLQAAQQRAQELGRALAQTEEPTKKQVAEFERAKKAVGEAKQAYQDTTRALDQTRSAMTEAGLSTRNLAQQQSQLKQSTQQAQAGLQANADAARKAADAAKQLGTGAQQAAGNVSALGQAAHHMAAQMAAAFALRDLVDAMAKMESARVGMTAITGSATLAAQELEFVRQVSVRIGADITETSKAFLGLTAATKGTAVEGEPTRQVFEAVATAMGKAGKSSAETGNALTALSQMASKGTVSMEELKDQLGEALPGALQAAATGMGLTVTELTELVESGKVAASDVFPALVTGLNSIYGGAPQAQTLAQEITNIKNTFIELADSLGKEGGLSALKGGAEVAQAAIVFLDASLVAVGKTIGTVVAATTTMDFSGFKQAMADIEAQANDKLLKAAGHNETLRAALAASGDAALVAGLKQQELAAKAAAGGTAAASAAQGQGALAGATDKAAASAQAAGPAWIKLASDYDKVLKAVGEQIAQAEKSVAAREAEQKAIVAMAQAFGTEKEQREAAAKAAQATAEVSEKLAQARTTELNVMRAQLDALKALGEEQIKNDPAKKKQLEDLQKQIALREQDVDKAKAQAAASRLTAESAAAEALAYQDNSKRLGELKTAYERAAAELERLRAALKNGKATQEEVTKAELEAGKAQRLYQDALSDTVKALEAKKQAMQAQSTLLQSQLELQKSSLEASLKIAEATGNEKEAVRLKIEIKRTEIAIIQETVKAQIAEAEASMALAKAKRAELEAAGQLTPEKKMQLEAEIKMAQASINAAKARGESVRVLEAEIAALQGNSNAQGNNANAIDKATSALERQNAERERAIAAQEKELDLATREMKLQEAKRNAGVITGVDQVPEFNSIEEADAWKKEWLKNYWEDNRGIDPGQLGRIGLDLMEMEWKAAVRNVKTKEAMDSAKKSKEPAPAPRPAPAPAPRPAPAPAPAPRQTSERPERESWDGGSSASITPAAPVNNYISNVTLAGRRTQIRFADQQSQQGAEDLLRALSSAKGASI